MIRLLIGCLAIFMISCKKEQRDIPTEISQSSVKYAQGFSISKQGNNTVLSVTKAFSESEKSYRYLLVPEGNDRTDSGYDAIIEVPIKEIVVTSTTHIPSLEQLGEAQSLIGFPGTDYISSEHTRKRIAKGLVTELGQNESLNTEIVLDLRPDAIVAFGVEGENKALNTIQQAKIPVLYNGDWLEKSPLAKAEWLKFFGALYNKEVLADSLFQDIELRYKAVQKKTQTIQEKPTVLSGAMYKDVWYLPYGDSWAGQLIKDAGGMYLWEETKGSGSISLSLESVLDQGQQAELWIAPGQYDSYSNLEQANMVYTHFDAYKKQEIYNFTHRKGETGGLLYYELAPNRPDIVLKDMAAILHPYLFPDYQPYFFAPLAE